MSEYSEHYDEENELIGLIYETALDPGLWSLVLEGLSSAIDPPSSQPMLFSDAEHDLDLNPPQHKRPYSPHKSRYLTQSPLEVSNHHDTTTDHQLYEKIIRHLKLAIQLRLRQQRIEQKHDTLSRVIDNVPIGVLVVDAASQLLFANAAAKRILSENGALTAWGNTIRPHDDAVFRTFRKQVSDVALGIRNSAVSMKLECKGQESLALMITQFDYHQEISMTPLASAMVMITPPVHMQELPYALLHAMYGFTRSEAALANGLIQGKRLTDIAQARDVSINTVRSQLSAMFEKSGTHRQPELIARLLGCAVSSASSLAADAGVAAKSQPITRHPLAFNEETITLRDGRVLGYAEYGDPNGQPIIHCHGIYGSRYEMHPTDNALAKHGLRLIVPDRPGVGLSDPQYLNGYADWIPDMRQLADHLEIDEFSVAGFGTGGNFALAAAWHLDDRIKHVTVVSPTLPISTIAGLRPLSAIDRMSMALAQKLPRVAVQIYNVLIKGAAKNPDHFLANVLSSDDLERDIFTHPSVASILKLCLKEIVRNNTLGMPHEVRYLVRPWGFDLADISQPVYFWRGQLDAHAPIVVAEKLMAGIPHATVHRLNDRGHALIYTDWDKIVEQLANSYANIRKTSAIL